MLRFRTILHPTDFTDCADAAFAVAGALARDHGARLVVLHVSPVPNAIAPEGAVMPMPPIDLDPLREQLKQITPPEGVTTDYIVVEGDPVGEILREAEQNNCDLIVMGTHGRRGLSRLVMGSVAEEVVRRAPCVVITTKARKAPEPVKKAKAKTAGA